MNKAIFSVIIAYVLLKQGYVGFQGNPVSPFASPFSSPFRVLVMSLIQHSLTLSRLVFMTACMTPLTRFFANVNPIH